MWIAIKSLHQMRVLWFINISLPKPGENEPGSIQGGWISSLEKHIRKVDEIQLGIVFPANKQQIIHFSSGGTEYFGYPSAPSRGHIAGLHGRWSHEIEPSEELEVYLKIIEQFKPDLIHVFGSEKQYGLIVPKTNVPVLVQIQGNLTACLQKWFSGLTFFEVLKYCNKKNFLLGYGIFHQYFLIRKRAKREQKVLSQARFIIGRTDWDKRVMRIMAPESRYFHCDELLRTEFHKKQWIKPPSGKFLLFSTLSPVIYKGLETVLKTASLLKHSSEFEFEWCIAGIKGTEEVVGIIERSQKMRYKENNVHFLGSLNAVELSEKLISSSLFIHPSHIENSPNSVCEAMLTGVPVIATWAGGTSSILKDGEEGILVQDGDPYALAGAILQLADSPVSMTNYSKRARQRALSRHDPDRVVNTIKLIYRNVIED